MIEFSPFTYNSYGRAFLRHNELPRAPRYFRRNISGPYTEGTFGFSLSSYIQWQRWFVRCGTRQIFSIKRYSDGDRAFIVEAYRFPDLESAIQFGLAYHYARAHGFLVYSEKDLQLRESVRSQADIFRMQGEQRSLARRRATTGGIVN